MSPADLPAFLVAGRRRISTRRGGFVSPCRLRATRGDQGQNPKISAGAKRKILGGNAARVYGVDLSALAHAAATDDLSWTSKVREGWESKSA